MSLPVEENNCTKLSTSVINSAFNLCLMNYSLFNFLLVSVAFYQRKTRLLWTRCPQSPHCPLLGQLTVQQCISRGFSFNRSELILAPFCYINEVQIAWISEELQNSLLSFLSLSNPNKPPSKKLKSKSQPLGLRISRRRKKYWLCTKFYFSSAP